MSLHSRLAEASIHWIIWMRDDYYRELIPGYTVDINVQQTSPDTTGCSNNVHAKCKAYKYQHLANTFTM